MVVNESYRFIDTRIDKNLILNVQKLWKMNTSNVWQLYYLILVTFDFLDKIGSVKQAELRSKCNDDKPTKMKR